MHYTLEQRFGGEVADEVYNHVNKVKVRSDISEEKIVHIEETNQDIWMPYSKGGSIIIYIYKPGYKAKLVRTEIDKLNK